MRLNQSCASSRSRRQRDRLRRGRLSWSEGTEAERERPAASQQRSKAQGPRSCRAGRSTSHTTTGVAPAYRCNRKSRRSIPRACVGRGPGAPPRREQTPPSHLTPQSPEGVIWRRADLTPPRALAHLRRSRRGREAISRRDRARYGFRRQPRRNRTTATANTAAARTVATASAADVDVVSCTPA
jgi:hypothetical protein